MTQPPRLHCESRSPRTCAGLAGYQCSGVNPSAVRGESTKERIPEHVEFNGFARKYGWGRKSRQGEGGQNRVAKGFIFELNPHLNTGDNLKIELWAKKKSRKDYP